MWLKSLLPCAIIALSSANASAYCKGVVSVTSAVLEEHTLAISVRVFAGRPDIARTVYYDLTGDARVQTSFSPNTSTGTIHGSFSTRVESGDEYADDEVEIENGIFGERIMSSPRIKQVMVTACLEQ